MLAVGAGTASADGLTDGLIEQAQSATNANTTDQSSSANAETSQLNVNAPISILSYGSNNGDVNQSNDASTTAVAVNQNETDQWIGQGQAASTGGGSCDPCGGGDVSQEQDGSNENETHQGAEANAETHQVNVNAPIAILSHGSNNGDVNQSNEASTTAVAGNQNETNQGVSQDQWASSGGSEHGCGGCGNGGGITQTQTGSNENGTSQEADANATTEQENWNVPVSILSFGGGDHGSCDNVKDGGCGGTKPDCGCSGDHRHDQSDVTQSNDATTTAVAGNQNATWQSVDQSQDATSEGSGECCPTPRGHDGWDKGKSKDGRCGCAGWKDHEKVDGIHQSQDGSNSNATDQAASATAGTEQKNVNAPFSFGSLGSGGGDVDQTNSADTTAKAFNSNATAQSVNQVQNAALGGGVA
jgi:hypothetical protein